jgi:hypothetical protein
VVSQVIKLVVRDEFAQRDRFMRENLDAMAQKVGEMQAKMIKLESVSERVSGMAGLKPMSCSSSLPSLRRRRPPRPVAREVRSCRPPRRRSKSCKAGSVRSTSRPTRAPTSTR